MIDLELASTASPPSRTSPTIARLNDYLSEFDTHEIAVGAKGRAAADGSPCTTPRMQLLNTTKPIGIGPLSGMECKAIFRMCAEIAGGEDEFRERPIVYSGVCPSARSSCRATPPRSSSNRRAGGSRTTSSAMAMAGGSSPNTLAGTLVTHNAEVLSGIVLAQLTERGCPVMYGSSTTAIDLKLAAASVGSPEIAVISAAVAQAGEALHDPQLRGRV